MNEWRYAVLFLLTAGLLPNLVIATGGAYERIKCKSREGLPFRPHSDQRHRLSALREEMRIRASVEGSEIDGYIITSYDEHLNEDVNDSDKRRQYISGFTGTSADVAITLYSSALWTDERYLVQADAELNCDWEIFNVNNGPSIPEWIASHLKIDSRVGADPHTLPHYLWQQWEGELARRFIRLVKVNQNLVDIIWQDRPKPPIDMLQVHPVTYAGEKWQSKVDTLRIHLVAERCDAIVVTSLTEIAYLLNLRGKDLPHTPVFKAYLIVTHNEIFLYTDSRKAKSDMGIQLHLQTQPCYSNTCLKIRDYETIWGDIRTYSQTWRRVLVPSHCVYDLGSSEAIFSSLSSHLIYEKPSPIIFMRAQKNAIEREGMQRAHVLDGAAMCEALSLLERRYVIGDKMTEVSAAKDVDLSRYALRSNKGTAYETIVGFGPHGALPHFQTFKQTDMNITDESTVIVDSGGQYLEGTTAVTRTVHFGEPTTEQKTAYTNVLRGIIRLSTLVFPDNLKPSEVDALTRSPVWGSLNDYPQSTGHGVGSYLAVQESPINIAYSASSKYLFKEGYFFSSEPAFYKQGQFGVRLENVLEVIDTEKRHPSGAKFLRFKDVTLVPYETKLIDRSLLSTQEKRWLNEYNAKIRDLVGEELKLQMNMQAFYWMMNKTRHIIEYYPESEYRQHNDSNKLIASNILLFTLILNLLVQLNLA